MSVDLKAFAKELVSLRSKEAQELAEVLEKEYGIELKRLDAGENLPISEKPVSRQVRRKMEREAKKRRK